MCLEVSDDDDDYKLEFYLRTKLNKKRKASVLDGNVCTCFFYEIHTANVL